MDKDQIAEFSQVVRRAMEKLVDTAFAVDPERLEVRFPNFGLTDSLAASLTPMGRNMISGAARREEEEYRRRQYEVGWDRGLGSDRTIHYDRSPLDERWEEYRGRRRTDYLRWYYYQNDCYVTVLGLWDEYSRQRWEISIETEQRDSILEAFRRFELYLSQTANFNFEEIRSYLTQIYERVLANGLESVCINVVPRRISFLEEYEEMLEISRRFRWEIRNECNCTACRAVRGEKDNEADTRAKELILSCLTESQREEFLNNEFFTVITNSKNKYQITQSNWFNVKKLDKKGRVVAGYCAGPKGINLPVYDWMLAQKCLLETDEEAFLKVANKA